MSAYLMHQLKFDIQEEPVTASKRPEESGLLLGECLNAAHPILAGRAKIRWQINGEIQEQWLATLQDMPIRAADRVLIGHVENWPEPVVLGILDGFKRRKPPQLLERAQLRLEKDEGLTITDAVGNPMVEIGLERGQPQLRILSDDLMLDMPGKLSIRAGEIEMEAKTGPAHLKANDNVVIRGEEIQLN